MKPHAEPPALGPYGRAEWNAVARRWDESLTDEGRVFLSRELLRWKHPMAPVRAKYPAMVAALVRAGHPDDDLAQFACVGYVRAAARFDPARGFAFMTYGLPWARSAIQNGIGRGRRIDAVTGTPPDHDGTAFLDTFPARDDPEADVAGRHRLDGVRAAVGEAMRVLDPRCRRVVELYFGLTGREPMTYREIGDHLGVCRTRVMQLLNRAKSRMDKPLRETCGGLLTE